MDVAKKIRSIAAQVSRAEEDQVPLLLLQLRDTINSSRLDARGQQSAIRLVWKCDLIHVLVGAVQRDFSQLQNGLETATHLAALLATVCSGLKPKESGHRQQEQKGKVGEEREQVREFYNILLPTAVDSLLILANSLLEHASEIPPPTDPPPASHTVTSPPGTQPPLPHVLRCFQLTLESLSLLCSSHKQCASRTLQSPYILHMIISNHPQYSCAVLTLMLSLLQADKHLFSSISEDQLQSILDELTYKLLADVGKEVKAECLKLLAVLVKCSPGLLAPLCSKYKTLSNVVSNWKGCGLGGDVEEFILSIKAQDEGSGGVADRAATVIQASWRGYCERRRMKRVDRGIRQFQQLYRKRKAEQDQLKEVERHQQNTAATRRLESLSKMRSFHEKQMSTLEGLPASDVGSFLQRQKAAAATTLQAWWRGRRCQRRYSQVRREAQLAASAVTIQRAFRKFQKRNQQQQKASDWGMGGFPLLEGEERELLQQSIASRRDEHPPPRFTELQMREVHNEVQSLLSQFYLRVPERRREEEKRKVLCSRLEQDCALLLTAPKLCEMTEEHMQKFVSGSHVVARMAHLAHREELRATELPWWKQPLDDATGDIQL